ncbi:MAG: LysM peptidoglycan-binding domain-containing protein [Bacillota bacterium]|nr:LysM peptidoglycan-binding domain-containing protein [Bacillota bacterium]
MAYIRRNIIRGRKLRRANCLLVLTLLIVAASMIWGGITAQASDEARQLREITICQGDTLWSLVEDFYDYDGDIRAAIYEVKKINDMSSSYIQAGDTLLIPVE